MSEPTIDTEGVAKMLGCTRRYATDVVTKEPWFPAPKINLSRRMRRWAEADVREAVERRSTRRDAR